jgi:hypothetical protein
MKYLIKSPLKPIKLLYHAIKSESYIPVEFYSLPVSPVDHPLLLHTTY